MQILLTPLTSLLPKRFLSTSNAVNKAPAIMFDIDGVFKRGKDVLNVGRSTLKSLYDNNGKCRLPFGFLTNGGGMTESAKAAQLSEWFDVDVREDQIVMSHSPFRTLVTEYGDKPILILGGPRIPSVAAHYGFKKAVDIQEYCALHPDLDPFHAEEKKSISSTGVSDQDKLSAILAFGDPVNWQRSSQICLDLVLSNGHPESVSHNHEELTKMTNDRPHLYFSNPDLLWAAKFHQPRLGGGAFKHVFGSLLSAVSQGRLGIEDVSTSFGKPLPVQYRYSEKVLSKVIANRPELSGYEIDTYFGIGDNPAADIRGANHAGNNWRSVLVRTGIANTNKHDNQDFVADYDFEHVGKAVDYILLNKAPTN